MIDSLHEQGLYARSARGLAHNGCMINNIVVSGDAILSAENSGQLWASRGSNPAGMLTALPQGRCPSPRTHSPLSALPQRRVCLNTADHRIRPQITTDHRTLTLVLTLILTLT